VLLFSLRNERKTCGRLQAVLEIISMIPAGHLIVFTTVRFPQQATFDLKLANWSESDEDLD